MAFFGNYSVLFLLGPALRSRENLSVFCIILGCGKSRELRENIRRGPSITKEQVPAIDSRSAPWYQVIERSTQPPDETGIAPAGVVASSRQYSERQRPCRLYSTKEAYMAFRFLSDKGG